MAQTYGSQYDTVETKGNDDLKSQSPVESDFETRFSFKTVGKFVHLSDDQEKHNNTVSSPHKHDFGVFDDFLDDQDVKIDSPRLQDIVTNKQKSSKSVEYLIYTYVYATQNIFFFLFD